jgi:microcystin-dependent protein
MRFVRLTLLLLLTAIFVVEPVVHSHPLAGSATEGVSIASPNVCALCAVAAQQITVAASITVAPAIVVDLVASIETGQPSRTVAPTLPSRAPPLA